MKFCVSLTITKLYFHKSRFWFLPLFLLRGLTWAVLHVWTQNYPQNFGTCPGLPLHFLARNHFFQSDRPEPPPPPKSKIVSPCCSDIYKVEELGNVSLKKFVKKSLLTIKGQFDPVKQNNTWFFKKTTVKVATLLKYRQRIRHFD